MVIAVVVLCLIAAELLWDNFDKDFFDLRHLMQQLSLQAVFDRKH